MGIYASIASATYGTQNARFLFTIHNKNLRRVTHRARSAKCSTLVNAVQGNVFAILTSPKRVEVVMTLIQGVLWQTKST